jgi:hypothetical protein
VSPAQVKALIESELKPELEIIGLLHSREVIQKAFDEAGITGYRTLEPK